MKSKLWLIILFIGFAHQVSAKAKEGSRWRQLMSLVNQEMKILENAKRKGPELYYRILELHSEKLKLIHEKNNFSFLEKSKTSNVSQNKEAFFEETRAYYKFTKNYGLKLMKDYPQNARRAEVLFALALNSRDYGKDNITERYLLDTISLVKDPHHSLRHHAETALADYYYNEKRYQEAVTYYERVIQKTEDEWLSKHYFNLSWCYLKVRDFNKAIAAIKQSYVHSKDPAYVNIKDQVLDNVGSFYVYAGRPLEGLEFYLKNEKDSVPYLLPMAAKTSEKGHQKETEVILDEVQKLIDKHDWVKYQEEVFHSYLDFYRHYNRFSDHEMTARKLVGYYKKADKEPDLKLKQDMKEDAIEKMRSLAGFLQVKLAKDMKEDQSNYKEPELNIVLNFFNHLIILDPKRKVEYLYFRGETYYSVRRLKDAAVAYVDTVEEAKLVKKPDYARKGLNSLFALTGHETLEKDLNKKYLIYAYSEHVSLWPRDEKSEQIYPKLFEIYRHDIQDTKATDVIRAYNKAYPEHLKDQQQLMTKILDLFIDRKDTKKLAFWIPEFKQGFLSYSQATIEKTEIVLGNILFLQYQEMAKKGDKAAAAKGFESIYMNKLYTNKVKSQSAFFAALAYLEMGETDLSYHWQVLAYGKMTEEEKLQKRDEHLKIAERTYKLQDFSTSYKISEFLLKKFCALKDQTQARLFEVAVMTSLVEEKALQAENVIKLHTHCLNKLEIKESALSQIYQLHEKKGDFYGLRTFVKRHPTEQFKTQYRYTLQKWFWEKSNVNLKSKIMQEFKELHHTETLAWLRDINLYNSAKHKMEELDKAVIWEQPKFNGEMFNKSLEAYLLKIQQFKEHYQHLTQSPQIDLAILSTQLFSHVYVNLGEKIQSLRPSGMDAQTMKEFQGAMKQLGSQFLTVSRQFDRQLEKALKDKETLAWGSRSIASIEEVENPVFSFFTGLTMDKGKD